MQWEKKEFLTVLLKSAGVVALLAYFFYRSPWAMLPLAVVGVWYFRHSERQLLRRDRQQLESQFGECLRSVQTALRAGYAVENAFRESEKDMKLLYGETAMISRELELIRRGMVINITLEELLQDLAERSDSDVIEQFAQVFAIAKRTGGNMTEVMESSVDIISSRIEIRSEIRAALSGRRMEQNIMKIMPFGILLYIGIATPGYFDSLYSGLMGRLVMTGLLAVYLGAYALGERILGKLEEDG